VHMSGPPRLALVPQNTSLPSDATDGSMILEAGVDLRSGRCPLPPLSDMSFYKRKVLIVVYFPLLIWLNVCSKTQGKWHKKQVKKQRKHILDNCMLSGIGLPSLIPLETPLVVGHELDPWSQNGRWFFSALLDQHRRFVDILADLPEHEALLVKGCNFTSSSGRHDMTTSVEVLKLSEFEATDCYKMRCMLDAGQEEFNTSFFQASDLQVSLFFENISSSRLDLAFKRVEPMPAPSGHLAACVGPYFSTRPYLNLQDYVRYYTDLGVEQFFVYEVITAQTPSIRMDPVMPQVTWLTYTANPKRFYFGQVPMMQDCHNRLRYAFDYVAYFDMDEYLVMNASTSLLKYLSGVMPRSQSGREQVSALAFETREFYAYCQQNNSIISLIDPTGQGKAKLPVWDILQWGQGTCGTTFSHTKNIVRPRFVEEKGQHAVFKFVSQSHHHLNVHCDVGFLKHFRMLPFHVVVQSIVLCSDLVLA